MKTKIFHKNSQRRERLLCFFTVLLFFKSRVSQGLSYKNSITLLWIQKWTMKICAKNFNNSKGNTVFWYYCMFHSISLKTIAVISILSQSRAKEKRIQCYQTTLVPIKWRHTYSVNLCLASQLSLKGALKRHEYAWIRDIIILNVIT